MRHIEINSDKTTMIVICLGLGWVLVAFLFYLYQLVNQQPAPPAKLETAVYVAAVCNSYFFVMLCLVSQLRKTYPYAIAGLCGMAVGPLAEIAMYWTSAPAQTRNFVGPVLLVLDIVSSGLVLVEGVRWFKQNVRTSANV